MVSFAASITDGAIHQASASFHRNVRVCGFRPSSPASTSEWNGPESPHGVEASTTRASGLAAVVGSAADISRSSETKLASSTSSKLTLYPRTCRSDAGTDRISLPFDRISRCCVSSITDPDSSGFSVTSCMVRSSRPAAPSDADTTRMICPGRRYAHHVASTASDRDFPHCRGDSRHVCLVSSRSALERLEENLGALKVQLTPWDLAAINDAAAQITVVGARYPEAMQQMIDR